MHVPQVIMPPHPSEAKPQFWPAGHVVAGVHVAVPQTFETPPPPHVSGAAHVPQLSEPPQPSETLPHVAPTLRHVVGWQPFTSSETVPVVMVASG